MGVNDDDGLPEDVAARAKAAFETRASGALLALVFDSLVDSEDGTAADHRLEFRGEGTEVSIRVAAAADVSTLVVDAPPGLTFAVDRVGTSGVEAPTVTTTSADGAVVLAHGTVRLRFSAPHREFHTDWFSV